MTNAEKYLKDKADINEIANGINEAYLDSYDEEDLVDCVYRWFNTTVKPTLTEDEKIILRNSLVFPFDDIFQTIGRNSRNKIYLTGKYCSTNYILKEEYQGLFQFINPRRRIYY